MSLVGNQHFNQRKNKIPLQDIKSKIRWAIDQAWLKGNDGALDEIYAPDLIVRRLPWHDLQLSQALKKFIAGDRLQLEWQSAA